MAKKILTNYDFGNFESFKFRFQNLATDPTGVAGSTYFNTATGKFLFHSGTAFVDPTARAQHTGTQLAATISDLSAVVQNFRLDQFAAPVISLSLNSQKIINLLPGTLGTDAVNFNQLSAVKNNTDWKDSARAATTANIVLSGLLTIDGITLVANDRVLVKNQTTATENGIYLASSGAWIRSVDADNAGELSPSTSLFVEEGTTLGSTQWRVTNTGTITVGTTPITFTQFGAAITYTGGTGISVAGTVISVDTTVVARKASATFGDGTALSYVITHGLGTQDIVVQVKEIATQGEVDCDIVASSTTQVTLIFVGVAPTLNQYRVTVIA